MTKRRDAKYELESPSPSSFHDDVAREESISATLGDPHYGRAMSRIIIYAC